MQDEGATMTTVSPVLDALTLNRYHLKVKGCTAPLDVESFQGREGLSTRYPYRAAALCHAAPCVPHR